MISKRLLTCDWWNVGHFNNSSFVWHFLLNFINISGFSNRVRLHGRKYNYTHPAVKSNTILLQFLRDTRVRLHGCVYTAVSTKVVQLESIKAYATIPKGMMGCGCSLLHRQVHEFSARWKAVL